MMLVRLDALRDDARYDATDWQAWVAGAEVNAEAFAREPRFELSGNLIVGQPLRGWLVWEVPEDADIEVRYVSFGDPTPLFVLSVDVATAGATRLPRVTPRPTPSPTQRPPPETVLVGDSITITVTDSVSDERDWTIVTVTDITEEKMLDDGRRPSPGNVFVVVTIEYEALAEDARYSRNDWELLVNGIPGGEVAMNGLPHNVPDPGRGSGSGQMVYEAPATGELRLRYEPEYAIVVYEDLPRIHSDEPLFEVLIRR